MRTTHISMIAKNIAPLLKPDMLTPQAWEFTGLEDDLRPLLMALTLAQTERPAVVFCAGEKRARVIRDHLAAVIESREVLFFPNSETIPFEIYAQSNEIVTMRAGVLTRILDNTMPPIVVTTIPAVTGRLLPKDVYQQAAREVTLDSRVDLHGMVEHLVGIGYRIETVVSAPGDVSMRGGIIDVFSPLYPEPIRIELFDDEVDSLRFFDVETQRSTTQVDRVVLSPAKEFFIEENTRDAYCDRLESESTLYCRRLTQMNKAEASQNVESRVSEVLTAIRTQAANDNIDLFKSFFLEDETTLLSYLPANSLLFFDEKNRVEDAWIATEDERHRHFTELLSGGYVMPGQWDQYVDRAALSAQMLTHNCLFLTLLPRASAIWPGIQSKSYAAESLPEHYSDVQQAAERLRHWEADGYRVLCLHDRPNKREAFTAFCNEHGLHHRDGVTSSLTQAGIYVIAEAFQLGGILMEDRVVIMSCDLFHRKRGGAVKSKPKNEGGNIRDLSELQPGDYIVHEHHGIGVYINIEHVKTGQLERDYILIRYAGSDKLYVPVDQFDLLKRYIGQEDKKPKISKLGTGDWQRTKQRVSASVKEIAENLIAIYAQRLAEPGFAFSPDSPLQMEFEDAFPYVETEDQLRAIAAVKREMEKPNPMDKLVCGDVGYGKTEVAMRAAFKAVCDGKQVAVLVPTTVLAQQHYETFRERFEPFGASVDVLSRFTSAAHQKEILARLKERRLDVVIGTHKLLNKNIVFGDLGLLIIDEEQRFGVSHKERIKAIRTQIDVLTLSATPIPRTLHLSMVGIRDMSLIETPPADRFPIQTYVAEHQPLMIEQAIRREMDRGGQVFIIQNRIENLEKLAQMYQKLVPEARIMVAHGKMRDGALEDVMLRFVHHEADILICTTIIETGLDIPNVNTLIVHDADQLGLSQLYQLRGRIGRSNRVAFAYLTYRPNKSMSTIAEKRLHTLKEYTAMGSGYRIAMKDLEMRGAGSLLGGDQHGHVVDVGFEMYLQLLNEEVEALRGTPVTIRRKVEIDMTVNAFLPSHYIENDMLRLSLYQRIEGAQSADELSQVVDELIDRFGNLPDEAVCLLQLVQIRILATTCAIRMIKQRNKTILFRFYDDASFDFEPLRMLLNKYAPRVSMNNREGELVMKYVLKNEQIDERSLDSMKEFLQALVLIVSTEKSAYNG